VGDVLAAVDAAGVRDRTAVVVLADHGMETSDPALSATWEAELAAAGVPHLEVGGGLIYLT
jgi:arylsulfatase A-like enzyme